MTPSEFLRSPAFRVFAGVSVVSAVILSVVIGNVAAALAVGGFAGFGTVVVLFKRNGDAMMPN